jgi:glucose-1-phosphate cytidylyltransferase
MKVVILAGGLGTRLSEETEIKPKPMVEVGGRPILWHIMKHYASADLREFCLALGYKSEVIKRYFLDYYELNCNLTVNLGTGDVEVRDAHRDHWRVHCIDTGLRTNTGGRLRALRPFLEDGTFMLTYGDGVSNVDLKKLLAFHKKQNVIATVTAVRPPARFGGLVFNGDKIAEFTEKPQIGEGWINGGFMVFEPVIFNYLKDANTNLEVDALEQLAREGQLAAYRHEDFWQCMDNKRDLTTLERLWQSGNPPWKTWDGD